MTDSTSSTSPSTFQLRRRTPGSFVLVPCPKLGRSLRCQGQLERATAVVLAACPQITDVKEQPMEIWYSWRHTTRGLHVQLLAQKSKARRLHGHRASFIVPDFLVSMLDNSSRLIEVKPSRKLDSEIVQRKLAVAKLHALSMGWKMHVLTETDLFGRSMLPVLALLARYRVIQSDNALCSNIQQGVPTSGIAIGDLVHSADADPIKVRTHIYHLLAVDALSFDPIAEPLTDNTVVFSKGVITWDPFDSAWASSSYSTGGPIEWSANSPMTAIFPKMQSST